MQSINSKHCQGKLYAGHDKSKAMIVVTGSDGGHKWASEIAETFSSQGISSYALPYWKDKGLSKTLSLIPIEIIQSAVAWLKEQGYEKIGIYGVSKGSELALISASLLPEIEFVIAVSPACCVFEGIAKPKYSGASSWKWQGKPLPFVGFKNIEVNILKNAMKTHEWGFTSQYLTVIDQEQNESNTIKVENINGPILLLTAKMDSQWPSALMTEMIVERLKEKQFSFPVQIDTFDIASHLLCPVNTIARFVYRIERSHPTECNDARQKALDLAIRFLNIL